MPKGWDEVITWLPLAFHGRATCATPKLELPMATKPETAAPTVEHDRGAARRGHGDVVEAPQRALGSPAVRCRSLARTDGLLEGAGQLFGGIVDA
jgi:hypothetical protein